MQFRHEADLRKDRICPHRLGRHDRRIFATQARLLERTVVVFSPTVGSSGSLDGAAGHADLHASVINAGMIAVVHVDEAMVGVC